MNNKYAHRMGKTVLRLTKPDGTPLSGETLRITQTRQKMLFGCAEFGAIPFLNGELEGEEKRIAAQRLGKALDIFNFITLPFYWGRFEPEQGKPDTLRLRKTAEGLRERGCLVKGHPLCWHTVTAPWLLSMSDEDILQTQLGRIRRDVTDFAGLVDTWDVINEVVIMPVFDRYDNGITRICKYLGRIKLCKLVFAEAKAADSNALLLINDFHMGDAYDILIEGLLEAGVPIGAIGLQSHMHQGCWNKERIEKILARFSRFGLPLHFTEINLVSGDIMPPHVVDLNDHVPEDWPSTPEGEARQAADCAMFYKTLYEHPLVEAITYWSFTDGGWLNAPAGILTKDARPKPAYHELHKLIKGEWQTADRQVVTDANGAAEITGFKGEYTAFYEGGETHFVID